MMTNDMPHPDQALIYRASNRLFSLVIPKIRLEKPLLFHNLDRLEQPSPIVLYLTRLPHLPLSSAGKLPAERE